MKVSLVAIDKVLPYARNPRINEQAVGKVAASIKEFGWKQPIVVDAEMVIIVGHTRLLAAQQLNLKEVPVLIADDLTPEQVKAYRLADNRVGEEAEWDAELLALELQELDGLDFDLDLTGFDEDELSELMDLEELFEDEAGLTDENDIPALTEDPVTVPGDVWLLGKHRVMCGDSTYIDAVEKLMNGKRATLLHADPPYGMGKQKDGVANDNLYEEKLDQFQLEWWATFRTFLIDNASVYIWGNAPDLWRLWYVGGLQKSERLTLRNEIVWAKVTVKGNADAIGMSSPDMRGYPEQTERCLFFMIGEQGFNNNADNYWDGWEPLRKYLDDERQKMNWAAKEVHEITGTHMFSHWFTTSQWTMISKENYEKLQRAANGKAFLRPYDETKSEHKSLLKDHESIRSEFYKTRAYFDNVHENMTNVWSFERVKGDDRHGHATPKPVEMIARAMKSSSEKNDIVIEPFGGSGSTLMACETTQRICHTMELLPEWVDVIVKRWQAYTGKKAKLESDQRSFDEVKSKREKNKEDEKVVSTKEATSSEAA